MRKKNARHKSNVFSVWVLDGIIFKMQNNEFNLIRIFVVNYSSMEISEKKIADLIS